MEAINEEGLRKAASWQAFKEGRELKSAGLVRDVKGNSASWSGTVQQVGRNVRVKVVVHSSSHIAVRCSCPENQRAGVVCAHAVATGLEVISPKVAEKPEVTVEASSSRIASAWGIRLPATWAMALRRGRLSCSVKPLPQKVADTPDLSLCEWLGDRGLGVGKQHPLVMQGASLEGFLEAVRGHPDIQADGDLLRVEAGERIPLACFEREGDDVRLKADLSNLEWIRLEGRWWKIDQFSIVGLGSGPLPEITALDSLMRGREIRLRASDFLREVNEWREHCLFPESSWLDRIQTRYLPHRLSARLSGGERQLTAYLTVQYEGHPGTCLGEQAILGLPKLETDVLWQRNNYAETLAIREWQAAGFVRSGDSGWILSGEQAVNDFLAGRLPAMRKVWQIEESGAVSKLASRSTLVTPEVDIRDRGGDWLSFSVDYRTDDGEILDPSEVRRLIQGGRVTTRRGKVCRMAGGKARAWQSLLADLETEQQGGEYRVNRRSGMIVEEAARAFSGRPTSNSLSFFKPSGFVGTLRPYQEYGAAWLDDRTSRLGGGILADDMGLGKTIQTIAWAEGLFQRHTNAIILVLTATSLIGNWKSEWRKFAPGRAVHILHGANREAARLRLSKGEVWVTSHGTVVRDLAWYLTHRFDALVVDEASLLRNPDTDMAKAVRKLKADCKIALTGTPIENRVTDLWSIFSWVQPGWLGNKSAFREHFEKPSLSEGAQREIAISHLKLKTAPFILRRTKQAVAQDLPSKVVIDEYCELLPEQAKLYAELAREGRKMVNDRNSSGSDGRSRMAVLTTLLRLRQVCCDPALVGMVRLKQKDETKRSIKHLRLSEILNESIASGRKILVFSQFQQLLKEIENSIKANQWSSLRLDGQTRNRQDLVERFQSEQGPPIFLISLKAGGYGLNLTAADVVIHMDPWWNPAAEDQATDRAHRIGQLNPVTVYRLLTRGTVEDAVVRMQRNKRAMAAVVDESDCGDPTGWSMEELMALMATGGGADPELAPERD